MNKNIDDEDRIVIGVREWAVETALKNRAKRKSIEYARELEDYVLRGIADYPDIGESN